LLKSTELHFITNGTFSEFCAAYTATCTFVAGTLGALNIVLPLYVNKPSLEPENNDTGPVPTAAQLKREVPGSTPQGPAVVVKLKVPLPVVLLVDQPAAAFLMPPIHLPALVTGPLRVAKVVGSEG